MLWVVAWALAVVPVLSVVWFESATPVEAASITVSKNPTTCSNVTGIGTTAWTSPTNALTSDANYATTNLSRNTTSNYLRCSGYGFAIPTGAVISGITVKVDRVSASPNANPTDNEDKLMKAGATVGTSQTASAAWSTTQTVATFGGAANLWGTTWAVSDVNNTGFGFSMVINATKNNTPASVDSIVVDVTYSFNPTFTQTNYQWYTNADSLTLTSPLNGVAQNTATTAPIASGIFRLRQLLRVTTDVAPAGQYTFKLQYGVKGGGACSAATYADVTTLTPIAYADNTSLTDGQLPVAAASPTDSGVTIIPQEYNETNDSGIVTNILSGQDGLWDFALKDLADTYGTTYCLRMVHSSGAALSSYAQYPTISTSAGTQSIGFVDNVGSSISTPSFSLPAANYLPTCQTNTTTFGTSGGTKLRVVQVGNAGNGWNIAIAPTGGTSALWYASDTGAYYDFNDPSGSPPGCNSGSDGDTYAGQLTLDTSTSSLNAQAGCSTSGLTTNSGAVGFSTSTPAITVLAASSAAQSNCWWDLYNTGISQTIPTNQWPGSYSLNLTVTITAS